LLEDPPATSSSCSNPPAPDRPRARLGRTVRQALQARHPGRLGELTRLFLCLGATASWLVRPRRASAKTCSPSQREDSQATASQAGLCQPGTGIGVPLPQPSAGLLAASDTRRNGAGVGFYLRSGSVTPNGARASASSSTGVTWTTGGPASSMVCACSVVATTAPAIMSTQGAREPEGPRCSDRLRAPKGCGLVG
jgi:hypothetical protein